MNNEALAPAMTFVALARPGPVPTSMRYPPTTPPGAVHRNVTELPTMCAERFVGDEGCALSGTTRRLENKASPSAARIRVRETETAEIENTNGQQNNWDIVSTELS